MDKKHVAVIGGGIAGMEVAGQLAAFGINTSLIEKSNILGGHAANWHHVFPDFRPASEITNGLKQSICDNVDIRFGTEVHKLRNLNGNFDILLTDGEKLTANAIVLATGFDLFDSQRKEEYGYGIYNNIITSANLEEILREGRQLRTNLGKTPEKIAFIHCVGSRDEKVGNTYCSKVCCITGVKQAIEVKKLLPKADVYNFYMDLRMFDRYFEDLYYEAQTKHHIRFIRGRLSEACENKDGTIVLKSEDTLAGKPLKLTVDLVVLLAGISASHGTKDMAACTGVNLGTDSFFETANCHESLNLTNQKGIFTAGACTGPKSIAETIADARSAALQTVAYLKLNK